MRCSHTLDRITTSFDDRRLIADAGLLLPATLAEHLGLEALFDQHVDLGPAKGRAHVGAKALTLIMSALAGGDCIDDADALRAGGSAAVLGQELRAPSTLGTFLRSFSWAHARQLDVVSREVLRRAWAAGAGPAQALTIDLDSTICQTYGLQKEGGTHFTYSHVRGYHPLLAVAAGLGDVLHSRLRGGSAQTIRGAASFLAETFARVHAAGFSGALVVRADSGFYSGAVTRACRRAGARFSITVKLYAGLRGRIEALPEESWTTIPYWQEGGADVAELAYTPFADAHPDAREVRLIVRRVRPTPGSQLALFTPYSYHAFITDRAGAMLALEADHRRHAEVENTIRDLKYGVGLDHLPSGRFGANAAWLALQVLAHDLARWTSRIGLKEGLIATKTLRRRFLALPGRLARSARRLVLHLPRAWPWADRFAAALRALRAMALPLTT